MGAGMDLNPPPAAPAVSLRLGHWRPCALLSSTLDWVATAGAAPHLPSPSPAPAPTPAPDTGLPLRLCLLPRKMTLLGLLLLRGAGGGWTVGVLEQIQRGREGGAEGWWVVRVRRRRAAQRGSARAALQVCASTSSSSSSSSSSSGSGRSSTVRGGRGSSSSGASSEGRSRSRGRKGEVSVPSSRRTGSGCAVDPGVPTLERNCAVSLLPHAPCMPPAPSCPFILRTDLSGVDGGGSRKVCQVALCPLRQDGLWQPSCSGQSGQARRRSPLGTV